jgi:hypothetical protein
MIETVIANKAATAGDWTSLHKGADGRWTDDADTPVLPGAGADAKGLVKAQRPARSMAEAKCVEPRPS